MTCASCANNCCPEAPAITVNNTTISFGGVAALLKDEVLVPVGRRITLTLIPVADASLFLFRNTTLLVYGTDYTLNQNLATLLFDPAAADVFVAKYMGTSGSVPGGAVTGQIQGWGGDPALPPSGWLVCDGSAVSRSIYSALFAAISTTYGVGDGSLTFNLPSLSVPYYDGTTLVTRVAIIKA